MIPATQIFRTSHLAFLMTMIGAVSLATWATTSIIIDSSRYANDALPRSFIPATLLGYLAAIVGASMGGLLALVCGARLSRQYCWLFGSCAGLLAMWCGGVAFARTLMVLPTSLAWMGGIPSAVVTIAIFGVVLGLIGGGITWGILMTRRRIGFAARSRRAALIGMLCGAGVFLALIVLWNLMQQSSNQISYAGDTELWLNVLLGAMLTTMGGIVPAVGYAERYEAPRFAVLPIVEPQPAVAP